MKILQTLQSLGMEFDETQFENEGDLAEFLEGFMSIDHEKSFIEQGKLGTHAQASAFLRRDGLTNMSSIFLEQQRYRTDFGEKRISVRSRAQKVGGPVNLVPEYRRVDSVPLRSHLAPWTETAAGLRSFDFLPWRV